MNYKYTITINQYAVIENGLNLDITDLAILEEIKDFYHCPYCTKVRTQDGEYFQITPQRIINDLPILGIKSKQGIYKHIDKLIEAEILVRVTGIGNTPMYRFGANYEKLIYHSVNENLQEVKKVTPSKQMLTEPVNESLQEGVNESLPNYNINNNYNIETINKEKIYKKEDADLFGNETDKSKKHLFALSKIGKLVHDNDYTEFLALYADKPDFQGIDLVYYFNVVRDWSDTSDTKRTDRGWLATINQFIRSDIKRNQLHKIGQNDKPNFSDEELLNFMHSLDV